MIIFGSRSLEPYDLLSQVHSLSLVQIEDLCDVLLDFTTVADLEGWLQQQ